MAQSKVNTSISKVTNTVKQTVNNAKKDPIGTAATAAKTAVGGVSGAVQTGISAAANSKLLKGTKVGTTVDLVNTLAGVPGVWKDIGIDTVAGIASGIYQGKPVSQLDSLVVAAAKKSTKGNVDAVVDKTIACLKAYDKDFSKQDLAKFAKDLKQSAKAKYK